VSLLFWRPPCLLRVVLVNLIAENNTALRGVLWSVRGPWLTLRDAAVIKADSGPMKADGELIVHRDNIAFIQVLSD
jgi:hypothetical protein